MLTQSREWTDVRRMPYIEQRGRRCQGKNELTDFDLWNDPEKNNPNLVSIEPRT